MILSHRYLRITAVSLRFSPLFRFFDSQPEASACVEGVGKCCAVQVSVKSSGGLPFLLRALVGILGLPEVRALFRRRHNEEYIIWGVHENP